MNVTLNISVPVLLSGQGFQIRHRVQFTSIWTDDGVFTTNSPTITGLDFDTCYEFEITFLNSISPLIGCDPIIQMYCTPQEQDCITIDTEIRNIRKGIYHLYIDVTFPSPFTNPCGGYKVYYAELSSPQQPFQSISYSFIPTNFLIANVDETKTYIVQVYAIDCEGNEQLCDTSIVSFEEPPCTAAVLNSTTLQFIGGIFILTFNITQSTPTTNIFFVQYNQCQIVSTGVPDGGNVQKIASGGNPEIFTVQVNPNFNVNSSITYCGSITDGCNFSHNFDVTLSD